jgi:iron complex outermembrane recepter protein
MLLDRDSRLIRSTVRAILGLASCSAVAWGAQAQEGGDPAPDETLEEIVVTGFRQSLNVALDVKRDSIGSVDAIVAEDIADFPDLNLAESIQRIPGVSIARDAGEGRTITVRGLSPEFTRVRLNGMEAMSANGSTDATGGTNRGRGFDFNTFASELFRAVTVRKTASADTEEGSLGATVDLRTGRPFDFDELTIVTSANALYNDLSEDIAPRGAFLISDTFADGRFGALLSVAYTERSLTDEGSSSVRWGRPAGGFRQSPNFSSTSTLAQINAAFAPRIPRYDHYEHEQDRLGVTAAFQFAPSERTQINVDALYAEFNAERQEIFLEVPNFSAAANGIFVREAILRSDGTFLDGTPKNTIVYGVFENVDIRSEQRFDELTTEFTQFTIDGTQELTDTLKLNALAGYSQADHDNPQQTTLLFDWNNIPSLTYDYRGNDRLPLITYGGVDLTSTTRGTAQTAATSTVNSNGWYLSQVRLRPQTTVNEFRNYQLDLQFEPSEAFALRTGLQLKEFEFDTTEKRIDPAFCNPPQAVNANAETCAAAPFSTVPLSDFGRVFSYGGDLGIPSGSTTQFLIPDVRRATSLFGLGNVPTSATPSLANNRRVEEEDLGAFAQVDFKGELGSMPLRGNLGVRYVETDMTSWGYSFLSGTALLIKAEREYTDTLPSLNLALNLTDELIVRGSFAKVMSRPQFGLVSPGGGVTVSGNNAVAALGNPNINPTRAKAYDVSFEWYFAPESLVSLALFYKDIESRPIAISLTQQVFTGNPFGIPDSVAIAACGSNPNCSPSLPMWTFNTSVNGPGGNLKGFELSYQQPFSFLPGFLSNFGTILNYTDVDSKVAFVGGRADLIGLSNHAYNATLYYETERYGARVSAAYRDEFLTNIPGRDGNEFEGTADVLTIDASARFSVNERIDVTLEALNLTDEFEDQWVDEAADRLSYYHHTGRSYILGALIKF